MSDSCANLSGCNCEFNDELTSYKGICSEATLQGLLNGTTDNTWTQFYIPETLEIPNLKPDIEQILSVTASIQIISQRVIKTPTLIVGGVVNELENAEGIRTTGRKLVIEGILHQKVIYTADVDDQSVHSAHFDIPFSAFIILPTTTLLSERFTIESCIEDIFACIISKRKIFKNVTIFLKAKPICV